MKNPIIWILLPICVISCAQVQNKQAAVEVAGPPVATLSSPTSAIPPRELSRYLLDIKSFVDRRFDKGFNGSILVAKNGQIIYEKYGGFANPRIHKDSITAETSFHLASVSKTFTAMAVLKLWEQGKLDIHDSVSRYLPGFPCQGVTVKSLLNHRSGIPKYDHYMEGLGWDKRRMVTNQDVLDFIIAHYKNIPIRRPELGFSYSNTNFALLALIIEKVSGMKYPQYMKQTFFDPLGMTHTYVFTMADSSRYLPSYYSTGRPYKFDFLDLVYGDKNIYSTAHDLLKWDQALRSDTLFKKQTLDSAYAPYSFEKRGTHNYGLGWRMYVLPNGKKLIFHTGWWHGNRTIFCRLLDEDATIIALCNNDSRMIYKAKQMADFFGDYMQGGGSSDEEAENNNVPTREPVRHKVSHKRSHTTVHKKKTTRTHSSTKK